MTWKELKEKLWGTKQELVELEEHTYVAEYALSGHITAFSQAFGNVIIPIKAKGLAKAMEVAAGYATANNMLLHSVVSLTQYQDQKKLMQEEADARYAKLKKDFPVKE